MIMSAMILAPGTAASDIPVLKTDSALILTKDGSAVCGTNGAISAADLAAEFDGTVTVKDPAGNVIDGETKVPTGSVVSTDGGALPVLIMGDANIDGAITLSDVSTILMSIAKWDVELDKSAADPDNNGNVNLSDVAAVLKHIAKWDVKLGYTKIEIDENPQTAAAEDAGTKLWADHGTAKLEKTDATSTDKYTYVINAAKNEGEGATVYISPDEDKKDVTVSATPFTNCYGDTVKTEAFTFYYHNMKDEGFMPDALMPTESTYTAKITAGNSQGFYVGATTTEETAAGLYESTVSIYEDGAEIKRAKLYLNVWDLTLDDADAPRSAFGMGTGIGSTNHNIPGDDLEGNQAMYKTYYDFLLDHRICSYVLPYGAETDEADEYLNDPRMNSFAVYGTGYGGTMDTTIEQLQARYEKMKDNPDWLKKAYFYCADEPYDGKNDDDYEEMRTTKALIDQYFPGGKQVVAVETGTHITRNFDGNFTQYWRETTDILCPKTYAFIPQKYYGIDIGNAGIWNFVQPDLTRDYGTYANFADTCVAEEPNKESWWYFAGLPAEPLTTYHAHSDGMYVRMSGFQMYQEDVTGVLYYCVDDYRGGNGNSVFNGYGMQYSSGLGFEAWGNGIMVFSGMRYGYNGPIGSVRLEYIRDSFEDYMYLKLAERTIGSEATDALVLKVTRDLVDFETDAAKMQAVRAEIAEAIMAETAK